MISFENPGAFGCRTDRAFAAGTNTFAAADALLDDTHGLVLFETNGLRGAGPHAGAVTDASVFIKTNKAS
jgi:hypothetical protein